MTTEKDIAKNMSILNDNRNISKFKNNNGNNILVSGSSNLAINSSADCNKNFIVAPEATDNIKPVSRQAPPLHHSHNTISDSPSNYDTNPYTNINLNKDIDPIILELLEQFQRNKHRTIDSSTDMGIHTVGGMEKGPMNYVPTFMGGVEDSQAIIWEEPY